MGGRRGYEVSVEQALTDYADMVYRIAVLHMKNKADAEDVFQEVFLRLVKYARRIESEEHLKAWLIRVTVNCCKKQFDSAWNRHRATLTHDMEEGWKPEEDTGSVLEEVRKLPEHYRDVIHLFYYEEYSVREISRILEQSESTIKTRLSRAREMLRKALKGEFGYGREI